jgi:hypothetical protein
MPRAWDKIVEGIKKDNKKSGISDKQTNPYAIATSIMQKKGLMKKKPTKK